MNKIKLKRFYATLGPGLLYAGAAIGVSHLVQSTRAGAEYGYDLLLILLAVNILKYPFFEFAARYVFATGDNLIKGYSDYAKWALYLFLGFTVLTMFPVQAALTIVTAGLANNLFQSSLSPLSMSALLMLITMALLLIGHFKLLDKIIKVVIIALCVSTLIALSAAIMKSGGFTGPEVHNHFDISNKVHIYFLIAFIGWMPGPIDLALWSSLWSQAKNLQMKEKPTLQEVLLEFRVGYFGTMVMAAVFLVLGALIMYGTGEKLSANGSIFASQLISLYTKSIGNWAYPVIAVAALTTMLSTTITVTDAYPRAMRTIIPLIYKSKIQFPVRVSYAIWIIVVSAGGLLLICLSGQSMRYSVDLATTLSFLTAPVLAYINLKIITSPIVRSSCQPGLFLRLWSWTGIFFLSLFTLFYIWVLIFGI